MTKNSGWYWLYIAIGICYVALKIVFVLAGHLHTGAILHGLIPAVCTVIVGIFAGRENTAGTGKNAWTVLLIVFPILVLVTTPIYMYLRQRELWLAEGRLPVLILYESFAIVQLLVALRMRSKAQKTMARGGA
jgi:D-alanyl-lipoteichoic acid acyltransferase DltB (MBOAT superfamily)